MTIHHLALRHRFERPGGAVLRRLVDWSGDFERIETPPPYQGAHHQVAVRSIAFGTQHVDLGEVPLSMLGDVLRNKRWLFLSTGDELCLALDYWGCPDVTAPPLIVWPVFHFKRRDPDTIPLLVDPAKEEEPDAFDVQPCPAGAHPRYTKRSDSSWNVHCDHCGSGDSDNSSADLAASQWTSLRKHCAPLPNGSEIHLSRNRHGDGLTRTWYGVVPCGGATYRFRLTSPLGSPRTVRAYSLIPGFQAQLTAGAQTVTATHGEADAPLLTIEGGQEVTVDLFAPSTAGFHRVAFQLRPETMP